MRTGSTGLAALIVIGLFAPVPEASGQSYHVVPSPPARARRAIVAPARPPIVVYRGGTTYRVYRQPANPRQRPSAYDSIEYDARRPNYSFDRNLWLGHNY